MQSSKLQTMAFQQSSTSGVDFSVTNTWEGGFQGAIAITNQGDSQINGWTLEFEYPNEITQIWNAEILSRTGNTYVIHDAGYDAEIAPNGTVSFGFVANGSSSSKPSGFALNGELAGTPTPTPVPDPIPTPTPDPAPTPTPLSPPSGGDNSGNSPSPPLNPNVAPSENFDLLDWTLSIPVDENKDGKADNIKELQLADGFVDNPYFYTASDGGMVFKAPVKGPKTSKNTKYTRTELREMLRRGDTSVSTKGVGDNNWVLSSAPSSAQDAAGGVDGELTATLAVNHVTTTGDSNQVGRVIIGQIHANDDEPLRIYYRKLPGNSKGSIYIAHEPLNGPEQWYEMIGSRSDSASNPADGIALDEQFSYKIDAAGNTLTVTIMRPGKPDVVQAVDMTGSGFDGKGQYMYFKAGVYNQNNTGDSTDYAQATFYALDNKHTGYSQPTSILEPTPTPLSPPSGGDNSGNPPSPPLNPNVAPSENFDLLDWTLSIPVDENKDGKADNIKELQLADGFVDNPYFYTASDGGMVFKAPVKGPKTSKNTKYTRTELREMLRRGDTSVSTKGVGDNNWVLSSAPSSAQDAAGGVDGELTATLAVNHVTTTGDSNQVGRVIIGQIHANDDEPLRIYYRKLPGNSKGSIYIAHEPLNGPEQWYEMIGSRSDSASNPADGIALDEQFSYKIDAAGNTLTVTIMRPGKPDVVQAVDMTGSGFDGKGQYMYFKAGVYNQNNTGDSTDYAQATFYALDNKHTGYSQPTSMPRSTSESTLISTSELKPMPLMATHTDTIRINVGGDAFTDNSGHIWAADKHFKGGQTYSTTAGIGQTADDTLFQSERFQKNLAYAIPVENGDYRINLHFDENYFDAAGQRVFDVSAEGVLKLDDFDIYAAAGGKNQAVQKSFQVKVTDGSLNLDLNASVNNAKLSGIEVLKATPDDPLALPEHLPNPIQGSDWNKVFEDTFNDNSFDTSTWYHRTDRAYKRSAIEESNGALKLHNEYDKNGVSTGAWIQSREEFKFGYFEADVHFERENNGKIWPTWWIWGGNSERDSNGNRIITTEFDLFEYSGFSAKYSNNKPTSTHHYRNKQKLFPENESNTGIDPSTNFRDGTQPHKWGMLWTPWEVSFFYDGQKYLTSKHPEDAADPSEKLRLIFSTSPHLPVGPEGEPANPMGGPTPGEALPSFIIDNVQVWQRDSYFDLIGNAIRINAGGDEFTDHNGNVWDADKYFKGGQTYSTTAGIGQTTDDALFQSERFQKNLSYVIPLETGAYTVNLSFDENYFDAAGKRVFDVSAEGALKLDDFDIYAAAGGKNQQLQKSFQVEVTDGFLNLDLNASVDNAKLSAIEVLKATPSPTPAPKSIRFEAETMQLTGYRLESGSFASGGKFIGLMGGADNEIGQATLKFTEPTGKYDIRVGYFDENDGFARLAVEQNQQPLEEWTLNQSLGSNVAAAETLTTHQVASGVQINSGDLFTLKGFEQGIASRAEHARIDYIEFVPSTLSAPVSALNATSAANLS